MTSDERLAQGRMYYERARQEFMMGRREWGWVALLGVVACVVAANGKEVNIDCEQMARDLGHSK